MARHSWSMTIGWIVVSLFGHPAVAAENPLEGDLRDLRVGVNVEELSVDGYVDLACGNDGGKPGTDLAHWSAFRRCSAEPSGLREVAFRYDESQQQWAEVNDAWEGTKVAGHPVISSLLIDDDGIVQGIRIITDPDALLYLKKKAFLLPIRIMGRYGRDGWDCTEAEPSDGKTPVGGMFIDRRCEKAYHDRHLIIDTDLYRAAEQQGREFTGATRLEIFKIEEG